MSYYARWRADDLTLAVLGQLIAVDEPMTAAELAPLLSIDEETTRRALAALERYGQIRRIAQVDGSSPLYVPIGGDEREYIRCRNCETVMPVAVHPLADLRRRLRDRFGHELHLARFAFVGVCDQCGPGRC